MIWWRHNQYLTYLFRFWLYLYFFRAHSIFTFILCHFGYPSAPSPLSTCIASFCIVVLIPKGILRIILNRDDFENQQWFACNRILRFIYRSFVFCSGDSERKTIWFAESHSGLFYIKIRWRHSLSSLACNKSCNYHMNFQCFL